MTRTSLIKYNVLPYVVGNRIYIHQNDNIVGYMPISRFCSLYDSPDGTVVDLVNFVAMTTKTIVSPFIVNATYSEKNQAIAEMYLERNKNVKIYVGDKIHITLKRGIYTVISVKHDHLLISCETWKQQFYRKQRSTPCEKISIANYAAHAGGRHNAVHE